MSTADPHPEMSATEELVAYLDGELSFEESRRVERRLATDEDYRREMSELDQAWSALEELPQAAVKSDFAHTTIEMVTVAAKRDLIEQTAALETQRRRSTMLAAAGCVALVVAAFALGRMLLPNENHALLADLPVIAQLDALTEVENIEFLRDLANLGIDDKLSDDDAAGQKPLAEEWSTPTARRNWVEQLSDERKAELAAKLRRFQLLVPAPQSQDRLRKLQHDIAEDADHAKLQKTMAAYTSWLAGRSQGERVDLRSPDLLTKDRLNLVKQKVEREGRTATWQLSLEDERRLQDAVLDVVAERRQELMREMRGPDDRNPQGQSTGMVAWWVILRELRDPDKDKREQIQVRLVGRLSPDAQKQFDSLTKAQRVGQLRTWLRAAMQPKFGPLELERYFTERLSNDQRERLLALPEQEMEERLEQMYVSTQLGRPDPEWTSAFGGPGPNRGGPPGPPPRGERRGPFGRDNPPPPPPPGEGRRGPRDWDRGPRDRGPDGRRPDGPPDERGPRGHRFDDRGPNGPPPGGPPPEDWRDRPPPPEESGPPPQEEPR